MSRGPARLRQGDVEKALRAAKAAGLDVIEVRIRRDDTISVITKTGEAVAPPADDDRNEWDTKP